MFSLFRKLILLHLVPIAPLSVTTVGQNDNAPTDKR